MDSAAGAISLYDAERTRTAAAIARGQECEVAYRQLQNDRVMMGVGRLSMGVNLVVLLDGDGWRGRTGAKSFRRFLIEEGIEPRAAYQYMEVARAFIIEHGVDPRRIALVSMRLLVHATKFLTVDTVEDVVNMLSSLPATEAKCALGETFDIAFAAADKSKPPPLSPSVYKALGILDTLTFEERSEFYRIVHLRSDSAPQPQAC